MAGAVVNILYEATGFESPTKSEMVSLVQKAYMKRAKSRKVESVMEGLHRSCCLNFG